MTFERKLYVVMKRAENEVLASPEMKDKSFFYIPSLSSRTIVYKGLLLAPQIANFYQRACPIPDAMSALVPGPPALLDQYVPHLATGASVPHTSATTARSTPYAET